MSKCTHDIGDKILAGQRQCPLCLAANLALATRLLRRAVTELNHHVCYEDAETMEFLNPKKEG